MRHLIIGNGPTGVVAAEALRRQDPAASICLLGDEPGPAYSRMAIPYLLMGHIGEAGLLLRKEAGHFERLRIEQLTGRAAAIDPKAAEVLLEGGKRLPYDRLLLATGSKPLKPPIAGIDLPGVHPCWTLEDARAVMRLAKRGSRVVQMGAGFIGCIVMESLADMGAKLTVVEMGDRMVPRMMNETAGGLLKRWCETKGVAVHTGTKVESIARAADGSLLVKLSGGATLPADLVISATGVRPAADLARAAGLECDIGVKVDRTMRTSDARIYAAGDVAQAEDVYTRNFVINAVQPAAVDMARVAGINMGGGHAESKGTLAMNVLDTLGLVSASFGQWQGVPGGETIERLDAEGYRYLCLQFDGDRLVGANALGLTEHVGVLRGLIQSGRRLGPWKAILRRDPFDLMKAYLSTVQAAA